MNTHWNTVSSNRHHRALSLFSSTAWFDWVSSVCYHLAYCGRSSSTSIPHFHVWIESQPRQFFVMWFEWQLILINRKSSLKNILHWLTVAESWEKGKSKKRSWLGFEPQTWKRGIWNGSGTATACWMAAHARHAVKPRCGGKQGKRPLMPMASHSVPMGVH